MLHAAVTGGNYSGIPVACGSLKPFFPLMSEATIAFGRSNVSGSIRMMQPTPATFVATVRLQASSAADHIYNTSPSSTFDPCQSSTYHDGGVLDDAICC